MQSLWNTSSLEGLRTYVAIWCNNFSYNRSKDAMCMGISEYISCFPYLYGFEADTKAYGDLKFCWIYPSLSWSSGSVSIL